MYCEDKALYCHVAYMINELSAVYTISHGRETTARLLPIGNLTTLYNLCPVNHQRVICLSVEGPLMSRATVLQRQIEWFQLSPAPPVKSRMEAFWYQLTQVHLEERH